MTNGPPPIARIRLARSWSRLLAVPALLVAAGAAMAVAGLLLVEGPLGYLVAALGLVPALAGAALLIRAATMHVDIEEALVRVRWLGGGREYALVPGPVTRVRLRGEQASALRARSGVLGAQVGPAELRGEERIEVVRLAPTRTAILVPTDRGRLAIAAASEPELLEALSRAARARKRLEDLAIAAPREPEPAEPPDLDDRAEERPEPPPLEIETPPHILTGIERAMLDERLARERLEVEAAQRAEAEADAVARLEAERVPTEAASAETAREVSTQAEGAPAPSTTRRPAPRVPSAGLLVLPLIATVGIWGAGLVLDRLPEPASDAGKLTALALVLAGPATSIAAIMARAWWPRLVGVVVTSGLAAVVFMARALFGP